MTDGREVEPWVESAQDELFNGWQRWTSFACIWAWTCIMFFYATQSSEPLQLPELLLLPNETVLFSTAATLLVILCFSQLIKSVAKSKSLMLTAALTLVIGSLLCIAAICYPWQEVNEPGWLSPFLALLGMILGGVSIALLKVAWGEMYSNMGLRRSLISISYAAIAGSIFTLLIVSCPLFIVSLVLLAEAFLCVPLVSKATQSLSDLKTSASIKADLKFSPALLILPLMVGLSYGLVRGILPSFGSIAESFSSTLMPAAGVFSGVVLLIFSYHLDNRFGPAQIYSIGLVLVVAGLILFAAKTAYLWLASFIFDSGFLIFYFFMVVHWGDLSRRTGLPIVKVYATGYFCFQGSSAIASLIIFFAADKGILYDTGIMVVLSVVLGLFIASLLLFGDGRSPVRQWLVAQEPAIETDDRLSEACHNLSESCGLSPRESEVLSLLVRGRNASYIASTLCISSDTAKSHIKNIYRKTGVHTQQNLLDEVDKLLG